MERRPRRIDPESHAANLREARLGSIPERQIVQRQETAERFDRGPDPRMSFTLGPWYRENLTASATSSMRVLLLETHSTTAATVASSGAGNGMKQHRAGKIVGAAISTASNITAGSATVGVRFDGGTAQAISDCVLNTTNPMDYCVPLGWRNGIPFAAGQRIEPVVITDASFAPTTADVRVLLFVQYVDVT